MFVLTLALPDWGVLSNGWLGGWGVGGFLFLHSIVIQTQIFSNFCFLEGGLSSIKMGSLPLSHRGGRRSKPSRIWWYSIHPLNFSKIFSPGWPKRDTFLLRVRIKIGSCFLGVETGTSFFHKKGRQKSSNMFTLIMDILRCHTYTLRL